MRLLTHLKTAARNHARFNRIYRELRDMDRATALDLGMFPEDAYEVAYGQVYGR